MRGFYTPDFSDIGHLSKLGGASGMGENFRIDLINDFLTDSETALTSKAFGSRNPILMYKNCDLGWLVVTNKRVLFWSDESTKPHKAINLEDIDSCNSRWAIMKQRSVRISVDGKNFNFGTHKSAARLIQKLVNDLSRSHNYRNRNKK
jgi:hypothetical protein